MNSSIIGLFNLFIPGTKLCTHLRAANEESIAPLVEPLNFNFVKYSATINDVNGREVEYEFSLRKTINFLKLKQYLLTVEPSLPNRVHYCFYNLLIF